MPRLILLSVLMFSSASCLAADSWFDSALRFFGFSDAPETPVEVRSESRAEREADAPLASQKNHDSATSSTNLTDTIVKQLGVSQSQAEGGLGTLFAVAKNSLASDEFKQLGAVVPNMDTLLAAAPAVSEEAGGLSGLLGSAGEYGKALQGATRAYSQFKSLGLGIDQIPAYIGVTNDYLQSQGSDDVATLFQTAMGRLLTGES